LKPSTLNTGNDKRDEHLRSEDFFYVSKYPKIKFNGNSIELQDANSQTYNVIGKLTIRGVTEKETIPVKLIGYTNDSKTSIKFTGSTKIDRNKYNVDYSGRMIADKAKIEYTIILDKNKK
jgi:polyisoprenoid-binding protein YceI